MRKQMKGWKRERWRMWVVRSRVRCSVQGLEGEGEVEVEVEGGRCAVVVMVFIFWAFFLSWIRFEVVLRACGLVGWEGGGFRGEEVWERDGVGDECWMIRSR